VVKNLPTSQTTCHANVHLFALCYTHDLRVYGYESILEKFVSEMENLRVNGFEGTFALIGRSHVYVHFTQDVCDNLALNGLLGSIECFSADYFCTMCMATQSAIQNCFHESEFESRTIADVENVMNSNIPTGRNHSYGVKKDCTLNKIQGYRVIHNYALDPMHILLEGVIPVELSCILHLLINVQKLFSLFEQLCD
jgi:hypothetical protein